MKAILVIDTPKTCGDCPLFVWEKRLDSWYSFCTAKRTLTDENLLNDKPNWCPLKPMPNKNPISEEMMDDETKGFGCAFNTGWNNCLDEIGEENEN